VASPLSDAELAGWRNAIASVQSKGTNADRSKMSDAERFLATIDGLRSSAAQYLREREVLEGALRELTDALTNTWFVGGRSGGKSILAEAWDKANVLLASLPSPEPTQGEQ
jgi:hypothetical protein